MKFIKDCTADELKQVFEVNIKLQRKRRKTNVSNINYNLPPDHDFA